MKYSLNIALLISLCLATGLHARAEDPMTFFETATPLASGWGPNSGHFFPIEYYDDNGTVQAQGAEERIFFQLSTREESTLLNAFRIHMERYISFIGRWYIPGTNTDIILLRCQDEMPENDCVIIYVYEPSTMQGHLFETHTYYHGENESQNPAEYLRYNIDDNTLILKTYQKKIVRLALPFALTPSLWTRVMDLVGTAGEIFELTYGID